MYDSHTVLLRYGFQRLKDIGKDSDILDAKKFKFLIDGIKEKNSEIDIVKLSVMNNNETGEMDTYFD